MTEDPVTTVETALMVLAPRHVTRDYRPEDQAADKVRGAVRELLVERDSLAARLTEAECERDIAREQHANALNRMIGERDVLVVATAALREIASYVDAPGRPVLALIARRALVEIEAAPADGMCTCPPDECEGTNPDCPDIEAAGREQAWGDRYKADADIEPTDRVEVWERRARAAEKALDAVEAMVSAERPPEQVFEFFRELHGLAAVEGRPERLAAVSTAEGDAGMTDLGRAPEAPVAEGVSHGRTSELIESYDATAGGDQFSVRCDCGYETPESTTEAEAWAIHDAHVSSFTLLREGLDLYRAIEEKHTAESQLAFDRWAYKAFGPDGPIRAALTLAWTASITTPEASPGSLPGAAGGSR